MDLSESTKVVCSRIQKLEPKNVSKIIGCLLFQLPSEREMIRLAFSPDKVIQSLVNEVKCRLGLSSKPTVSPPSQFNLAAPVSNIPLHFTPFSLPANSYWEPHVSPDSQLPLHTLEFTPHGCPESEADDYCIPNQVQFMSLKEPLESVNVDFSNEYYCPEPSLSVRTSRKVCHYYNMGFCKHGNNCRYIHGHPMAESFSQLFTPNSNELPTEDRDFSPGSLEKLELELTELLKSRRGFPVSIASLPMIYYEKYGRTLQAEGYLTESQRHGKAGYSLTKLLARLKSSIRLIDRPHGQHSVVLAEDVPKYMDFANDRSDPGGAVPGSRQIYLTFPAESTFSEHDVSNYFNNFGPVQDVRIPCQPKRMFGFVTFANSESVRQILAKGNPHFVCGARVLVKPYREKSRLAERKYGDKFQHMFYNSQTDFDLHAIPRVCDNSRLLKKQFFEEQKALELERRRLLELNLSPKPFTHRPYFSCSTEERKISQEEDEFPFAERFNHLLDVLNQESSSGEDKVREIIKNCSDESNQQGLKLPESPFASSTVSGNSTDA